MRRSTGVVLLAAALVAAVAVDVPAVAAPAPDVRASVSTWDAAAARLGSAGSLWEPMRVAGLERSRRITVIGDGITVSSRLVTGGETFAGTTYGRGRRQVQVAQKWAATGWSAEPVVSTSRALVGTTRVAIGRRTQKVVVPVRIYADCVPQPAAANPRPVPPRTRCSRADVRRFGGTAELTAQSPTALAGPGATTIVLTSTGLTYAQLLATVRSLQQVVGSPALGAGSAQMIGMCRQMVTGVMTADAARAFAESNGYLLRVGSVDGVPLALTMDYRPDRFTVAIVADAVTGCSYG